jgi:hypothetical protein
MKLSLERSNTYEVLKHRLGSALLAQQKIGGYFTTGLSSEQWKVEANSFFATSLARVQWDLWTIATGEDIDLVGYKDYTPDEAKGRLCGLYKFNKKGFANIHLAWFWLVISVCLCVYILFLKTRWLLGQRSWYGPDQMVIETLATKFWDGLGYCCLCISGYHE